MKKVAFVMPLLMSIACGEDMSDSHASSTSTGVVIRSAAGENIQGITEAVNAYRKDLGGDNNLNAVGTQNQGHREINWDGVPAVISSPNAFPGATFKNRGLLISSPGVKLQVSTKADESAQAAPLFGNLNANFPKLFISFSPEKLFAPVHSTVTELSFTVPGSDVRATVSGFGAVFTDVDVAGVSKIEYFDLTGNPIHTEWVKAIPSKQKSLSFVGVSFANGKRIAKVKIYSGNINLGSWAAESNGKDAVAMDDFLYGEPKEASKPAPQW